MGNVAYLGALLLGFFLSFSAGSVQLEPDSVVPPNCTAPGCQGHIVWDRVWDFLNQRWIDYGSMTCVDYDRQCDGTCGCSTVVLQSGVLWDTVACTCGGKEENLPSCFSVFEESNPFLADPYFVECRSPSGCGPVHDCRIVIPYEDRCGCQ